VLLTDGAANLSDAQVAEAAGAHRARPRATCLRLVLNAAPEAGEAAGALAMHIGVADAGREAAAGSGEGRPEAKKRKLSTEAAAGAGGKDFTRPTRVRLAQVLLKFAGLAADPHARRPGRQGRTQIEAERELLLLLEALQKEEPKRLGLKFAEACREHSDCKSALNTPHADLGWVNPGQWGKEFDAPAFELPVGGLSDVVITPRGAHILHRLA